MVSDNLLNVKMGTGAKKALRFYTENSKDKAAVSLQKRIADVLQVTTAKSKFRPKLVAEALREKILKSASKKK
jgi:hypothetical protein